MIRLIIASSILISSINSYSQRMIEWDGVYQLQLSDFQSPTTQIGDVTIFGLYMGAGMDFAYAMSSGEFMLTKNFNSKVTCSFKPQQSSIIAPDSVIALEILNFARYNFDLNELYSRKLRKRLYDSKGAFSNVNFFQPVYDQTQAELTERNAIASKETNLGRNTERLIMFHEEVLKGIKDLPDFCKTCKPQKRKK